MRRTRRDPNKWRSVVALTTATVLTWSLAAALPPSAGAATRPPGDPAPLTTFKPVTGKPVATKALAPEPDAERALRAAPKVAWPAAGTAEVAFSAAQTQAKQAAPAGTLPVRLSSSPSGAAKAAAPQPKVRVEVLDQKAAAAAGTPGMLVRLSRADGVRQAAPVTVELDYSGFRSAFGGDWASRLKVVALPACAATTPARAECRTQKPLETHNDVKAGRASAPVSAEPDGAVFALAATASGPTGDYSATPLAPAASWGVGTQSGTFTWQYPLTVPQVPGGLVPDLAMSYSSGGVDGRVVSTNNQASWIGEGWNLGAGAISWQFKACADDGVQPKTGDTCWAGNYATMAFAGHSGELIFDDARQIWRPKNDDGTRVEYLSGADNGDRDGNFWRVTTVDGTQYHFGSKTETKSTWTVPVFGNDAGEPCHAGDYAGSSCDQAWSWNLDYVVDRHGNTIKYFYDQERNAYGINLGQRKAEYTRAGTLRRIEYGTNEKVGGAAPAVVEFETADRCVEGKDCTQHTKESYVDTPWDQQCDAATCEKLAPAFFSSKRLAKVTTKLLDKPVDSWTLYQTYPDPGDNTSPSLWFKNITHTGLVGGSVAEPPVVFNGSLAANRVNSAADGLPPMNKFRIGGVRNEIGGAVQVDWAPADCTPSTLPKPETNQQRCFPVHWAFQQGQPKDDWFQKYAVGRIVQLDRVGGGLADVTAYEYLDGAAWHFTDNPLVPAERQTWSEWRGYGRVVERHGDPAADPGVKVTKKELRYFRGMKGDKLGTGGGEKPGVVTDSQGGVVDDADGLAGFVREETTFNGDTTTQVGGTITDPLRKQTAKQGARAAYLVKPETVRGRTVLAAGGVRRTESASTYTDEGILTSTNDKGDVADAADDQCRTITYARDDDELLLTLPSEDKVVGAACGTAAVFPRDAISDTRTYYDGGDLGAPPTSGKATVTKVAGSYPGGTAKFEVDAQATFDGYGRSATTTDALDRVTKVGYEPATGPPAKSTLTDPAGNVTTTVLDRQLGKPTQTLDVNGRHTDIAYDALGRVTELWQPGRSKDAGESGNVLYDYTVRTDAISSVATRTLKANENYTTAYTLYDGLGRERQTQSAAWMMPGQTARIVADKIYDSRGLEVKANSGYLATGQAGVDLFSSSAGDADVPSQTVTEYDGAGRATASVLRSAGVEQWRSTTEYRGDSIAQTPPKGGTATTAKIDARGRTTQLGQHLAATPTGAADTTKYSYTKAGQPESVTDAAGNVWSYGYDARGRTTSAKDPDKGESTMTYDAAGQLTGKKDARQQTVAYKYDLLGRRTETHADSADGPLLAQWTYDTVPEAGGKVVKGQIASSTRYVGGNAVKAEVTAYDAGYRPTATTLTVPASETGLAGTYKTTAVYNVDGTKRSETLPRLGTNLAEETVRYGYDDYGLPSTMAGADTYVGYTRYTPFGEKEMVRLGTTGAETWERRGYELASHRLARTVVEHAKTTDLQSDVGYAYEAAGTVKSLSTKVPGAAEDRQCFGNDYLGRITDAWTSTANCAGAPGSATGGPSAYWSTFGYDQIGNRKSDTSHGLGGAADVVRKSEYPAPGAPQPHAPKTVTTTGPAPAKLDSYGYTATGGTTGRPAPAGGTQTLGWDAEDRVVSAAAGSAVTTYTYDADGNRLITRDASGTTLTLPDGSELRYDAATKAVTGTRSYSAGDSTVATRRTGQLSGVSWMFQDRSGSDTVSVGATSFQVTRRLLDPFGQPRPAQPAGWTGNRGFAGGSPDPATGLTHLGARDYDTKTGKFLSVDPILTLGSPQQFNAYAYADNNPATKSDPTGLIVQSCPDGECPNGHGAYGGISGKNPATNDPVGGGKSVFDVPAGAAMPRACQGGNDLLGTGSIATWCRGVAASKAPACDGSFTSMLKGECAKQREEIRAVAAAAETERARQFELANKEEHGGLVMTCEALSGRAAYVAGGWQECTSEADPGAVLHVVKVGGGYGSGVSNLKSKVYVMHAKTLDDVAGWGWSLDGDAAYGPIGASAGVGAHFAGEAHPHVEGGLSLGGDPTHLSNLSDLRGFFRGGWEAGASLNIEKSWVTR
jgi:RHS repeat-associated protein